MPTDRLRVRRVLDLQPTRRLCSVWSGPEFRHYSFDVVLTDDPEQVDTVCLNRPHPEHAPYRGGNDSLKSALALTKGQGSKILAIEPQAIESRIAGLSASKQERVEVRPASRVEAHDFAIKNRLMRAECGRDLGAQRRPRPEGVTVPRHETAGAVNVCQPAEAVVLQLKSPVRAVEGITYSRGNCGGDARKLQGYIIAREVGRGIQTISRETSAPLPVLTGRSDQSSGRVCT